MPAPAGPSERTTTRSRTTSTARCARERDERLDFIRAERITDVIVLSADVHAAVEVDLVRPEARPPEAEVRFPDRANTVRHQGHVRLAGR